MNPCPADAYRARFRKVLEYIEANLDGELSLHRLSGVAAFSKYHFHRQFVELFGIGVGKYVQLCRLKRASYQLAFRSDTQITEIALTGGYQGPESFSRAFKRKLGQTPSEFRRQPQWNPWHTAYAPLTELRSTHMRTENQAEHVRIVSVDDVRVAVLAHRGDPRLLGDSIRRFIEWRKQNHLPPRVSATFNIVYDDPEQAPAEEFRFDLCAATDKEIADNPFGIVAKTIPGGRCAVLRHVGSDDALGKTVRYLYAEWLPKSGEVVRDFPLYFQRIEFFPDVPENEAVTDVFLPLK